MPSPFGRRRAYFLSFHHAFLSDSEPVDVPRDLASVEVADWPAEKLAEAKAKGSLLEASEVADVVLFMLTRPRGMTIRDVVMLPTNFDL